MKFQEFMDDVVVEDDVDYSEKIFEDMLTFIVNLDPELLSEDQLENILNIIDNLEIAEKEEISEVQKKVVIRGGKKVRKVVCKPGYKAQGNKCVKMKGAERLRKKKAAIKSARKRKSKGAQIAKKRARSMKKRKAFA